MQVELDIFERAKTSKDGVKQNSAKQLRRSGNIPVVIYSKGQPAKAAFVSKEAVDTVLREVEEGFLPTTTFNLKDESGKVSKALVKDIQYHVTTYAVLHIDFIELQKDHKIDVKVPIHCLGTVECVGVKGGGYIRQVMRHLPIRCLPQYIPYKFELDVKELDLRQAKRVEDLRLPEHVTTLIKPQEVIVSIVK